MKTAIEMAVATAKKKGVVDVRTSKKTLAAVTAQIAQGTALRDKLYGIEAESKPRVEESLAALQTQEESLKAQIALGNRKYHQLDPACLEWRNKEGWPRLVVFSLDSPRFEIAVKGSFRWNSDFGGGNSFRTSNSFHPKLPKAITDRYADVTKKLRTQAASKRKTMKLGAKFTGVIPDDAREKIEEAKKVFPHVFIVAEPTNLTLKEVAVVVPKVDPLVVGFDGTNLWLIVDFDTTPVEEAMLLTLPKK